MRLPNRRTLFALMAGLCVGLLISPLPTLLVVPESSCGAKRSPDEAMRGGGRTGNGRHAAAEEETTISLEKIPNRLDFNWSQLSKQELSNSVPAPGDSSIRYKKSESELAPRGLLYVGVITAEKYLDTRALGIYRTWGKEVKDLHFFSSPPSASDDKSLESLPIVTLPGVNDTEYPPQRKVYRMLQHMHDHFINQFDFFMRADDDVYVRVDRLTELLGNINPAQDIYMGSPGFGKVNDRNRIKLQSHEHYCMGGPGVIFSRSALRKLAPHLNDCLSSVVVSYNEDVEVGRCVSKKVGIQCTWSWEMRKLFWADYDKILPTGELYTSKAVQLAISLHPIKDPALMIRVHQLMKELQLQQLMQGKASSLQQDIMAAGRYLPGNMNRYADKRWLWYGMGKNPASRYELLIWEHFNSTRLFLQHEHMPVIGLPASAKEGINAALEVLVRQMNRQRGSARHFVPPYHLYEGFSVTDYSSGVEYVLHVSLSELSSPTPKSFIASIFMPLQGPGMVRYQQAEKRFQEEVHFVLAISKQQNVIPFLQHYEREVLKKNLLAHLHLGLGEGVSREKPRSLEEAYPGKLMLYDTSSVKQIASSLPPTALLVLMDYTLEFAAPFLNHCRINAVQGRQAYFPVFFSLYKPELVHKYVPTSSPQTLISVDTGFFLRYNYQVVAIYNSDYQKIHSSVKVSSSSSNKHAASPSIVDDSTQFVDKALSSDVYVMRSPEPYLRRPYRQRNCSKLKGSTQLACLNSQAEAIGSKKLLGSLVVANNLLESA